jgi:hypothetical protein
MGVAPRSMVDLGLPRAGRQSCRVNGHHQWPGTEIQRHQRRAARGRPTRSVLGALAAACVAGPLPFSVSQPPRPRSMLGPARGDSRGKGRPHRAGRAGRTAAGTPDPRQMGGTPASRSAAARKRPARQEPWPGPVSPPPGPAVPDGSRVRLLCSAWTAARSAGPSQAHRPTIVATFVGNSMTCAPAGAFPPIVVG